MSTVELLKWKERGLTIREISDETDINKRTLRSRYIAKKNICLHTVLTEIKG